MRQTSTSVQRARGKSIVCAGEALVDLIDGHAFAGGAPMNVACALSRLGTASRFAGCIGKDSRGDLLLRTLHERGVDRQLVQRIGSSPTRGVNVRTDACGDRAFVGFDPPGAYEYADMHLEASQIPANAMNDAQALVIGTLALASPASRAAIERCVALADAAGVPVVLDVNRRDIFWPDSTMAPALIRASVLPHAAVVKLSEDEAQWLFGTEQPAHILRACNAELVLVTHGAQGCSYATKTAYDRIAAIPVRAIDTTGAGDAFLGGVLHRLSHAGMSIDDAAVAGAVRYGVIAGALTTRAAGALDAQPTDDEVAAKRI